MISQFRERAVCKIRQLCQLNIQTAVMLNMFVLSLSLLSTCLSLNLYKLSGHSEYNDDSIFEYYTHPRSSDMYVDNPTPGPILFPSGDTLSSSVVVGTTITGIFN